MEVTRQLRQLSHYQQHNYWRLVWIFFWLQIALLLYSKSDILRLSFLYSKDLCPPNRFSRGSGPKRYFSTYLTCCQRRNWVALMIELMLIFNPSYACHDMSILWLASFVKFPWRCWTEFSQSWKDLRKTLKHWKPLIIIIDRSKWC